MKVDNPSRPMKAPSPLGRGPVENPALEESGR